jgi:hypothetical protein
MTVKIAYDLESGRIIKKYSKGKRYPDWWDETPNGVDTAEINLTDDERRKLLQNEKERYSDLSEDEVVSAWLTYDGSEISVDSKIKNI